MRGSSTSLFRGQLRSGIGGGGDAGVVLDLDNDSLGGEGLDGCGDGGGIFPSAVLVIEPDHVDAGEVVVSGMLVPLPTTAFNWSQRTLRPLAMKG